MKRRFLIIVLFSGFYMHSFWAQNFFTKGVNLTQWFEAPGVKQIPFTKYTRKDFQNIKDLGCDVIRLPINLHAMTSGEPDYTIHPLFYTFLDSAVSWAEKLDLNLILDNHTFDPSANTDPNIGAVLIKVWKQMAGHYKNTSTKIFYEILNEPHGIDLNKWAQIQENVINAIREVDKKHTIIVGAANWNSYHDLKSLPYYTDTNLIYTFHFYDPFLFTHQGATWVTPSMEPLAAVPFPYSDSQMPMCPESLKGTWIESSFNNYKNDGTIEKVKTLIDIAIAFQKNRKVKIFCGEFGVYMVNSNNSDRIFWYKIVRDYLTENNIPWTIWDYKGGFGLFKKGSNQLFENDLNVPLLEALGFNVPPQKDYVLLPDSTGFTIYSDYIEPNIFESGYAEPNAVDLYSTDSPNNGNYCISWNIGAQYTAISFDFIPDKDFSSLLRNGYTLNMMVRGTKKDGKIDIRILDTKTSVTDHPWRIRYVITEKIIPNDGYWHKLHIPFSAFKESGSWDDNTWYEPKGLFDWKTIDKFEIVAEYAESIEKRYWFDNIYISNRDTAQIYDTSKIDRLQRMESVNSIPSIKVYPLPMKNILYVNFLSTANQFIEITIYNLLGKEIKTICSNYLNEGEHSFIWDGNNYSGKEESAGFYFCKVTSSDFVSQTIKLVKN